ncbi:hypothetical protein [Algoriphagus sp.]|uniref:hypothetical protein n=1 Tax=Algoriphagus sp. TaxID=1872435 RepID=UPI003F70C103
MNKLNSLVYLSYYLLLWVISPSTGLGAKVFAYDLNDRSQYSVTTGEADFSDFLQGVNTDWTKLSGSEAGTNWLVDTGHWPLHFPSIYKSLTRFSREGRINPNFSNHPVLGALTASKIIFPFHYFW